MIWADVYEPRQVKERLGDICHEVALEVGDYQWFTSQGDLVIIERKTPTDLLHTISSGRFGEQISNLVREADIPILLLHGNFYVKDEFVIHRQANRKTRRMGWKWNSVSGHLRTALLAGVLLEYVPYSMDVALHIQQMYEYFQKGTHISLKQRPKVEDLLRPDDPEDYRRRMLMQLPGVEENLADRIQAAYPTFSDLMRATEKDLQEIKGIGPTRAKMLKDVVK